MDWETFLGVKKSSRGSDPGAQSGVTGGRVGALDPPIQGSWRREMSLEGNIIQRPRAASPKQRVQTRKTRQADGLVTRLSELSGIRGG